MVFALTVELIQGHKVLEIHKDVLQINALTLRFFYNLDFANNVQDIREHREVDLLQGVVVLTLQDKELERDQLVLLTSVLNYKDFYPMVDVKHVQDYQQLVLMERHVIKSPALVSQ